MKVSISLLFCLLSFIALSRWTCAAPPNILILLADDLKHHDLGITGCKDIPTPHIDALCASGTHFTQAYCTAPLCAPSRAGLLTGRNQARFGFDFNPEPYVAEDQGNRLLHPDRFKNGLPQSEKTLATYLKAAGYQTAWIGKWHLGEAEWAQPKNHGFDHCYGFLPGVQSYRPMTNLEAKRAGDTTPLNHCLLNNGKWVENTSNITDMLGAEASRYITASKEKPWFMYCAFNAPHGPHQPDPEREPKFAHITDPARRKLAATISHLDNAVGVIMASIRKSGQLERTFVIFVNDHGISSPGEWSGGKGTMMEGGLRSLLFASWPGKITAHSKRDDRVSFLDIAPTLLTAAAVPIRPDMRLEGTDLLADKPIPQRPLAWRMDEDYAFRDEGDWKLVGKPSGVALYDLKTDPLEKKDLASTNPEKLAELTARWKKWDSENARPMWKSVSEGAEKPTGADNRKKRQQRNAAPAAQAPPAAPSGVSSAPGTPAEASTISVRFTAPGKDWTGTLLSRRATPGEPSFCVTAFKHEPFGKRFIGVAMDGLANAPNQAAAKTVRDDVVGGHLVCAFTEMDAALDSGTHDLVFRTDGKTAELIIDGIRCASRSAEKFTARTFLKLYPHSQIGSKTGSDPDGGDVFSGKVEKAEVQPKWLTDAETGLRGEKPAPAENAKVIASGLFPAAMSDEQRMSALDAEMPRWLTETMQRDVWFPRFHVALPAGMMFDTRCAIHSGRYHLFPTWRADMNLTRGTGGSFRMTHLSSADLIHWRIEPFPIRLENTDVCNGSPTTLDGTPNFFFLRYAKDGAPNRATPTDASLTKWTVADPPAKISKEGEGYGGRLDSVVFQHGGKTYLTGTRRNVNKPSMAMPLYRSDDLASWSYIGDFFQTDTKPFNECPQIFTVGGKMVVAAFYPLQGRFDNHLVGRFENEKFIAEKSGRWDFGGHGHVRSFDADTAPDGRVIGWSTLSVYAEHDALQTARIGWKGMHSLPKEVTLRPDGTLALAPAKEIEQLRGEMTANALPKDHDGSFEIELTFEKAARLALTTPDGEISLSFDPRTRVLTADTMKSPKIGSDTGHLFKTAAITGTGPVPCRIFFDRSVMEIFIGGMVLSLRHYPADPGSMQLQLEGISKLTAWKMNGIWENAATRK